MNRAHLLPTLFYSIISLILYSCSGNDAVENQPNTDQLPQDKTESPFPDFSNFPRDQFKTICLGETNDNLKIKIGNMPVEVIAEEEVSYFHFPADSTELILPGDQTLTEFKIFLKSRAYLQSSLQFKEFLGETAHEIVTDDQFPVYHYKTDKIDFKLTYFEQPTFIRMHFILVKSHP